MLDLGVADMQARAARFAGKQRDHVPTGEHPFTVVLVDEVAFLTAYPTDRKLREQVNMVLDYGGCIRPVQLRRTDLNTGETDQVLVPCGHTLASVRLACAERARNLRAQCREGWHLDTEPDLEPGEPTDTQQWWIQNRAEVQAQRDRTAALGGDTGDLRPAGGNKS